VLSDGDLTPFFTRPISIVLWVITLAAILMNIGAVNVAIGRAVAALKAKIGFAR
jgi:putative tricarboxylic transport membrane protein